MRKNISDWRRAAGMVPRAGLRILAPCRPTSSWPGSSPRPTTSSGPRRWPRRSIAAESYSRRCARPAAHDDVRRHHDRAAVHRRRRRDPRPASRARRRSSAAARPPAPGPAGGTSARSSTPPPARPGPRRSSSGARRRCCSTSTGRRHDRRRRPRRALDGVLLDVAPVVLDAGGPLAGGGRASFGDSPAPGSLGADPLGEAAAGPIAPSTSTPSSTPWPTGSAARRRPPRPARRHRRRHPLPRRRRLRRPGARRTIAAGVDTCGRSTTGRRARRRVAGIELRLAATADQFATIAKFRAVRGCGPGSPRPAARRTPPAAAPRRDVAGDDDRLRPLGEHAARHRGVLRRRRRRRRRDHRPPPRPLRGAEAPSSAGASPATPSRSSPRSRTWPRSSTRPAVVVRRALHRRAGRRGVGVVPGDRGGRRLPGRRRAGSSTSASPPSGRPPARRRHPPRAAHRAQRVPRTSHEPIPPAVAGAADGGTLAPHRWSARGSRRCAGASTPPPRPADRPAVFLATIGPPAEFTPRARSPRTSSRSPAWPPSTGPSPTTRRSSPRRSAPAAPRGLPVLERRRLRRARRRRRRGAAGAGAARVYVAGRPKAVMDLAAAGVDRTIHVGADVRATLDRAPRRPGGPVSVPGLLAVPLVGPTPTRRLAPAAGRRGRRRRRRRGRRPRASTSAPCTPPPTSTASTSSTPTRACAVPARPVPDDVRQPAVDDPPVRRVLDGRGVQRLLPPQPRRRPEGPVGRVRPGHPPGLRLRPPPRRRRRRHGRRGHRLDPRHAPAVRPHPARPDERVDDDERRRAPGAGALHRGRRGAGRGARAAGGHDPERHAQGVHGPQHVHLPAGPVDADHLRHLRLHLAGDAEVQLDLDLRLPHAGGRGDGRPRARLHAGRRRRVRPRRPRRRPDDRRLRPAAVVLLGRSA